MIETKEKTKECPQCQHPMSDYLIMDACTFCGHQIKKNIIVAGKEFNPHDYHSLGDAIEYVWAQIFAKKGFTGHELLLTLQTVTRLQDLRTNIVLAKAGVGAEFLKQYGPYMQRLKEEMDRNASSG